MERQEPQKSKMAGLARDFLETPSRPRALQLEFLPSDAAPRGPKSRGWPRLQVELDSACTGVRSKKKVRHTTP